MDGDSALTIRAKFVSKKISKIRWRPTNQQIVEQPTLLVTGSWDEEDLINSVDLWTIDPGFVSEQTSQIDGDGSNLDEEFDIPLQLHSLPHSGDVSDLLYLNDERILASSSSGNVTLIQLDPLSQRLAVIHVWEILHYFPWGSSAACTAIASRNEGAFVSVGEDGRLNVVSLESGGPGSISTIDADSTSLTGVCFLRQKEVAAINTIGQFKVWDLRQSTKDPARVLLLNVLSGSPVALRCLDQHPTQPHIVATGGQNGELYIWDMRQDRAPATLVTCHQSDIWEVHFHPTLPNSLFTCSNDGSVFHWGNSLTKSDLFGQSLASSRTSGLNATPASSVRKPGAKSRLGALDSAGAEHETWLMDEMTSRDRLVVKDLLPGHDLPINSLDVIGSTLVCGTDGEEILLVQNLDIF